MDETVYGRWRGYGSCNVRVNDDDIAILRFGTDQYQTWTTEPGRTVRVVRLEGPCLQDSLRIFLEVKDGVTTRKKFKRALYEQKLNTFTAAQISKEVKSEELFIASMAYRIDELTWGFALPPLSYLILRWALRAHRGKYQCFVASSNLSAMSIIVHLFA